MQRGVFVVHAILIAACGAGEAPSSPGPQAGPVDASAFDSASADAPGSPSAEGGPFDASSETDVLPEDAAPLPGLNVDLSQTTVSGLSSGAFMAVQFGVAFSSLVRGIAVFAGGPFDCAQGSLTTATAQCQAAAAPLDVTPYIAATKTLAASGSIDDPAHLASARVFLFGGADDVVVSPYVVDATQAYFQAFVPASSIQYVSRRPVTGHTFPTTSYGALCAASTAPWIGACAYDGAGAALTQLLGPLSPASASPSGTTVAISQGDFIADPAAHSLGPTAYAYIPSSCASGEKCRIHIAFHGCGQNASGAVGTAFVLHAGYDAWADTNHLVVLYPQTLATSANPAACWDFWGYDSPAYDTQASPQMAMVHAMMQGLATGPIGHD